MKTKLSLEKEVKNKSTFYIVGTPIGNLEDMTFRGVRILKEADLILCEDTSNAQKLLKYYDIETKVTNYFANSRLSKVEEIINLLKTGKNVALISDAGMPTISDPGSILVKKIYEAKRECEDISVSVVPGPSALTAAYALSGFFGNEFTFFGFLPHKKGRETIFKEILGSRRVSIFYESSHRIEKCLESLSKILDLEREVVIAREITKMYEEVVKGNILEVKDYFYSNRDKVRGEFVVLIS
jgi:16S rRNA (cytidine1402-2'-O)-methyltransferase